MDTVPPGIVPAHFVYNYITNILPYLAEDDTQALEAVPEAAASSDLEGQAQGLHPAWPWEAALAEHQGH